MPKADELLRSFDAGDIRDVTVEELEELCEAPGDLGCSEQTDYVIPKEDTHPGPGLRHFDGKVKDTEPHEMLGK